MAQSEGRYSKFIVGKVCALSEDSSKITPLESATLQVFSLPDTTYVTGATSYDDGMFYINYSGDYPRLLLRVSYLGMETQERQYKASTRRQGWNFGMAAHPDSIVLRPKPLTADEVVIMGKLKKMFMEGDTLNFNADAFKLDDGAVLIDLIKKLPGMKIDGSKITYHDKNISEMRLNGKKFFANNMDMVLKNMPVEEIDKLKVYEDQTDHDRMTGMDTGKREVVMDMKTKRNVESVRLGDVAVGGITESKRYELRGGMNTHSEKEEYSIMGSMEDLPSQSAERSIEKQAMGVFNKDFGDIYFESNVNYNYGKTQDHSETNSETYMQGYNLFDESAAQNSSRSENYNASVMARGQLNKYNMFTVSADFTKSKSKGWSAEESKSRHDEKALNSSRNETKSFGNSNNASFNLNFTHMLDTLQHNCVYVDMVGSLGKNDNEEYTRSETNYYQLGDSIDRRNQYVSSPDNTGSMESEFGFMHNIKNVGFFMSGYVFGWNRQRSERNLYDINSLISGSDDLGFLPQGYGDHRVDSLSSASTHQKTRHEVFLRFFSPFESTWIYHVELSLQTQRHSIVSERGNLSVDTVAHFTFFDPTLRFGHRWKNGTELTIAYNGSHEVPSTDNLLPVVNNNDPLNITEGNPYLKMAYSQNLSLNYMRGANTAMISYSNTINEITTKETYNEQTGGRVSRPDNINGNWSLYGTFDLTHYFGDFSIGLRSSYMHNNQVGYLTCTSSDGMQESSSGDTKRIMKNDNVSSTLKMGYQWDRADITLSQSMTYQGNKDSQLTSNSSNTKDYTTTLSASYRFPFGLILSTDGNMQVRRGYAIADANDTEVLWNASIKYGFLKKKAASVELQLYDILHQRSNISRSISAFGVSETTKHLLNSYGLLTFTYKFKMLG